MQRRERGWARGGGAGASPGVGGRGAGLAQGRKGSRIQFFVLGIALLACARMLSTWAGLAGAAPGGGADGGSSRAARLLGDALGSAASWAAAPAVVRDAAAGATRYPSPPPATAPRAAAGAEPPPAPAAQPRASADATPAADGCRTCAVATMLEFNSHAVQLFKQIDSNVNRGLFVTFGSLGMQEFITNWVLQVQKKQLGPFVVGALDGGAVDLCQAKGYPAAGFGALTMNTTGAYWRQDEGTFLRMANLKTELLRGLLMAGWDIMMSDVDVLWFESPWPWVGGAGIQTFPEAAKMRYADVLISTDIVEVEADSEHASWLLNREYNTGIVFFRATNASLGLVKLWRERVEIEGAIKGLYINDQAVFNRMTHGQASGVIEPLELPPGEPRPDVAEGALRGVYMVTSPVMAPSKLRVAMGVLPMMRFCNGHVFFINRLPARFGLRAAAVHATYQYADEKTYSYGKRHRLRQAQGWNIDPPEYFSDGKFMRIAGDSLMAGVEYRRDALAVWRGKNYRQNNGIDLHFSMEAHQRELLRDAFALAQALGRILVLPEMLCFCDRYWWLTHACRMPGAESMPLPFQCPLDHIFDIGRWEDEKLQYREAGFLSNPRVPREVTTSVARLRVAQAAGARAPAEPRSAPEYDDGQPAAVEVVIGYGLSLEAAAAAVAAAPGGDSRVLEVDPRDLRAFCGFDTPATNGAVDATLERAFRIQVHICGEEDNILPLVNWDPKVLPLNCTIGYDFPKPIASRKCEKKQCRC